MISINLWHSILSADSPSKYCTDASLAIPPPYIIRRSTSPSSPLLNSWSMIGLLAEYVIHVHMLLWTRQPGACMIRYRVVYWMWLTYFVLNYNLFIGPVCPVEFHEIRIVKLDPWLGVVILACFFSGIRLSNFISVTPTYLKRLLLNKSRPHALQTGISSPLNLCIKLFMISCQNYFTLLIYRSL